MNVFILMKHSLWHNGPKPKVVDVYLDSKVARRVAKELNAKSRDYTYAVRTKKVREDQS